MTLMIKLRFAYIHILECNNLIGGLFSDKKQGIFKLRPLTVSKITLALKHISREWKTISTKTQSKAVLSRTQQMDQSGFSGVTKQVRFSIWRCCTMNVSQSEHFKIDFNDEISRKCKNVKLIYKRIEDMVHQCSELIFSRTLRCLHQSQQSPLFQPFIRCRLKIPLLKAICSWIASFQYFIWWSHTYNFPFAQN